MFIDTHCHIHEASYPLDKEEVLTKAHEEGVSTLICVGTNRQSSIDALAFAKNHAATYASIGVHPHDAKNEADFIEDIVTPDAKLVAIGEIGLDYFYEYSDRMAQIRVLERQLQCAQDNNLPVIFHVRDASSAEQRSSVWNDFWPIFDNFKLKAGVLHSFTDSQVNADKGLSRGLYFGVNGISTFTKDPSQQEMFANLPLERIVLETDAPFLTPRPFRGKVNMPSMVVEIARFHAAQRGVSVETIATQTTENARTLFTL